MHSLRDIESFIPITRGLDISDEMNEAFDRMFTVFQQLIYEGPEPDELTAQAIEAEINGLKAALFSEIKT